MSKYSILELLENAFTSIGSEVENISPGVNGPYNDPETLCRNYSHWLIILSTLYTHTHKKIYKDQAEKLIGYLSSSAARPMGASFFCRKNPHKDFSNGLMGQAWVMESLIIASKAFQDEELYLLALNVYKRHPFDKERGLWKVLNVDGSYADFDFTFNHQLWFASIAALLGDSSSQKDALTFLNKQLINVEIYNDGVIYHKSPLLHWRTERKFGMRCKINCFIDLIYNRVNKRSLYSKSVGYHSFNLYAISMLNGLFEKHKFFSSKKFSKISSVTNLTHYKDELLKSKYSYPYNPPGFEEAVFVSRVYGDVDKAKSLIVENLSISGLLNTKDVHDESTSKSRLYELCLVGIDFNEKFIPYDGE